MAKGVVKYEEVIDGSYGEAPEGPSADWRVQNDKPEPFLRRIHAVKAWEGVEYGW